MSSWISIAKPGVQSYTRVNPQGREQYDQADLSFDDSLVFYDGVNQNQWTDVLTPTTPTWDTIQGTWNTYTGTWDEANWSKVNKPT